MWVGGGGGWCVPLGRLEQHVLVVDGPLPLGLQLIVRVPLGDVGVWVAEHGPPPH